MSKASRKTLRKRRGSKKLDISKLRQSLRDERVWCCLGIVQAAADGGLHFELDGEDLLVDVQLMPSEEEITARVGTVAGSFGAGVWSVPPIGAEVLVAVPDGQLDFQPIIIGLYSSGTMPSDVSENTIVIAAPSAGQVLIHDGAGGAVELALKSDVQEVIDAMAAGTPVANDGGAAIQTAFAGSVSTAGTPTGTTVLKAK